MAAHIIHSLRSIVDTSGIPISGALITVYDAGTTTKRAIYSDSALSTAADNPIVCTGGVCPLRYTGAGSYKVVVTEADLTALTRYNGDNLDTGVAVGSGALPVASGGTAATTAAAARTSLAAASATEVADIAVDVATLQDTLTGVDATQISLGTTAQRPVSPANGQLRRNSTIPQWEGHDGTDWRQFHTATEGGAAQTDMEAATATDKFVPPSELHNHPAVPKAWGYITWSAGTPTLTAGYKVGALTDNGTGDVTAALQVTMSSANFAVIVSARQTSLTNYIASGYGASTTSIRIFAESLAGGGTAVDITGVYFAIFGDLA